MTRFAANTTVTIENSKAEVERTLTRYGAEAFSYGWDGGKTVIQFVYQGNMVKFQLPLPQREEFAKTPAGKGRTENQIDQELNQARRQRWRALALIIKAKLEAVESGIVTFEAEFLSNLVIEHGKTVAEIVVPQIQERRLALPGTAPAEIEILEPVRSKRLGGK